MSSDVITGSNRVSRRRFFALIGWGAFASYIFGLGGIATRFFYPKVLYEALSFFRAGEPDDYLSDSVSTALKKAHRVWMIHGPDGIYALIAICTHLGCTPNWFPSDKVFRCPCHGSVFTTEGDAVAGPAPVPLYRAKIELDRDGKIHVDKAITANFAPKRQRPPYVLKV